MARIRWELSRVIWLLMVSCLICLLGAAFGGVVAMTIMVLLTLLTTQDESFFFHVTIPVVKITWICIGLASTMIFTILGLSESYPRQFRRFRS